MHHDAKFEYNRYSHSEDIIRTNNWNFEASQWPWPWTQHWGLSTRLVKTYHQTRFGCKRISRSGDISWEQHTLILLAFTVTLAIKTVNQPFCVTLRLIMMQHRTKLVYERSSGSEDTVTSVRTTPDKIIPTYSSSPFNFAMGGWVGYKERFFDGSGS